MVEHRDTRGKPSIATSHVISGSKQTKEKINDDVAGYGGRSRMRYTETRDPRILASK